MTDTAIRVENLSTKHCIGRQSELSEDVGRRCTQIETEKKEANLCLSVSIFVLEKQRVVSL